MATEPNPRQTVEGLLNGLMATSDSIPLKYVNPTVEGAQDAKKQDIISIEVVSKQDPPVGISWDHLNREHVVQVDIVTAWGKENDPRTAVLGDLHHHKVVTEARRLLNASRKEPATLPSGARAYDTLEVSSSEPDFLSAGRTWRTILTVTLKSHWEAVPT